MRCILKYCYLCSILLWACEAFCQNAYNTVTSKVMTSDSNAIVTKDYYDGIGRKYLTSTTTQNTTIATHSEYDLNGREATSWLPAPINASIAGDPVQFRDEATEYYYNEHLDSEPYTIYRYDGSPLNRRTAVSGPGYKWHYNNKVVATQRFTNNTSNSSLRCLNFKVVNSGLLCTGYVTAGKLDVVRTIDEDNHTMFVFSDIMGREILRRQCINAQNNLFADTYFIYDNGGNLRYILPPEASKRITVSGNVIYDNNEIIAKYCFVYEYDDHNRLISKKLPGCENIIIEYDNAGRPVFSQDGNQRAAGKWTYYSYDFCGRLVEQGLVTEDVSTVRNYSRKIKADHLAARDSDFVRTYATHNDMDGRTILLKNYFDLYNLYGNFAAASAHLAYQDIEGYDDGYMTGSNNINNGLKVATAAAVLNADGSVGALLPQVFYYDRHGNVAQSRQMNAYGGYDNYYYRRSLTGKPLALRHEHSTADTAFVDTYTFAYDGFERLLSITLRHDDATPVVLTANHYDEIGRLTRQDLLDNVRHIDYQYEIRGWTKRVDCPGVFRQDMLYTTSFDTHVPPCYNGDISTILWRDNRDVTTASYSFTYDGMDRLAAASFYGQAMGGLANFSTTYTYDANSNVTSLCRHGITERYDAYSQDYGVIDNLTMTYNGNQITKTYDSEEELTYTGAMDFKDGVNKNQEYTWDANGNMTADLNKGITEITYNTLNLPAKITFGDRFGDRFVNYYTYAADGRKLAVTYKMKNVMVIDPQPLDPEPLTPSGTASTMGGGDIYNPPLPGDTLAIPFDPIYQGGSETTLYTLRYCGDYIYRDSLLELMLTPGGFMARDTLMAYVADYQGNVRAVVDKTGAVREQNNYYPYGLLMPTPAVAAAPVPNDFQPFKYSAKELDRQHALDLLDFGARLYDPARVAFTTVDPLAEKTPGLSPYTFCAANPVRNIDPTGMDYHLVIYNDHISIEADYYCTQSDYKATQHALSIINNQHFTLNITNNGTPISLPIIFNTQAIIIDKFKGENYNQSVLSSNGKGNVFRVVNNGLTDNQNATTLSGNYIKIKRSRVNTDSGAHEVGHTLGATHSSRNDLMSIGSSQRTSSAFSIQTIDEMIKYPLDGRVNGENGIHAGKGELYNKSDYDLQIIKKGKVKHDDKK